MMTNESLRHGRQLFVDVVVEVGKTDLAARAEDAVFDDEPVELTLFCFRQRVPSRPQIGEFGLAARPRELAGRKQRALRGNALERAVGVPKLIAEVEQV